jgi:peptidoglycan/LPS O-acetylase OafA/YrhL
MRQFGIAGNPFTAHTPAVMDGSLWTLFYEAICYLLVAGLGLVGVLRRSRWMVAALCGALWLLIALSTAGINPLGSKYLLRLSLLFMLGAAGFLFAERLVISNVLAGASAVVVLAGALLMSDYRAIGAPAFAYLCLWAIVCVPLRQTPKWDLSYGLYVYHWPIVQFLVLAGVTAITIVPYIIVCVALALLAAVVSWNLVEKPALSFKNARWVDQSRARARGRRALGREPDHLEPALTMSDVLLPMTQPHPALTGPHPGAHPGPPAGPQQRPTRPQSVRFQET